MQKCIRLPGTGLRTGGQVSSPAHFRVRHAYLPISWVRGSRPRLCGGPDGEVCGTKPKLGPGVWGTVWGERVTAGGVAGSGRAAGWAAFWAAGWAAFWAACWAALWVTAGSGPAGLEADCETNPISG